jgi:hypothetical protein
MLVSVAALTATLTATQLELPDCNTYYTPLRWDNAGHVFAKVRDAV